MGVLFWDSVARLGEFGAIGQQCIANSWALEIDVLDLETV